MDKKLKETSLLMAVRSGDQQIVHMILETGGVRKRVINARSPFDGDTALIAAVKMRNRPLANLLLNRGANVNLANYKGEAPYQLAATEAMKDLLFDYGAIPPVNRPVNDPSEDFFRLILLISTVFISLAILNSGLCNINVGPPMNSTGFVPVSILEFTAGYFKRQETDSGVIDALIDISNNPGKGVLVISGDGGVGKTTMVQHLLTENNNETQRRLAKTTAVFWLDTFKWQHELDDEDKNQFNIELVNKAKLYDSDFSAISAAEIIPYFRDKRQMHVLFVFDNLGSLDVLKYFIKNQNGSSLISCAVITRDPTFLQRSEFVRRHETITAFGVEEIKIMLEDFYGMKGKLKDDQLETLATSCWGLPLIASLIRNHFGSVTDSAQNWASVYEELLPTLNHLSLEDISVKDKRFKTVRHLFEFSIDRLTPAMKFKYYAFLFFDPGQIVDKRDLKVLWGRGSQSTETINKFVSASLVRTSHRRTAADEEYVVVHNMLFDAALAKAYQESFPHSEEKNEDVQLQKIRFLLFQGGPQSDVQREMPMFEAVRQQRIQLCGRFVQVMDAQHLAILSVQESFDESDDGKTFLHFLYHFTWSSYDSRYPDGHSLERLGINPSYRIIANILRKFRRYAIKYEGDEILQVVTKGSRQSSQSNLLTAVFDDEEKQSQYHERKALIYLLGPWRPEYIERLWRAEVLTRQLKVGELAIEILAGQFNQLRDEEISQNCKDSVVCFYAILSAARCGQLDTLERLWNITGANSLLFSSRDEYGRNALTHAAANGHAECVKFLAERINVAYLSGHDEGGWTPLLLASKNGHVRVVEYLVSRNPYLLYQTNDNDGITPLIVASITGRLEVARYLLAKDRSMLKRADFKGSLTPLIAACGNGYLQLVDLFIQNGVDLLQLSSTNDSALMAAAEGGHVDIVKYLIRKIPSRMLSHKNVNGQTALWFASKNGHFDVVNVLLNVKTSDVILTRQDNNEGQSAICAAGFNGHLDVVMLLAEKDLETAHHPDNGNRTPMIWAAYHGHVGVVRYLAEKDASLLDHVVNENGWTSLIAASVNGHLPVVKYLVSRTSKKDRAMLKRGDINGATAIFAASMFGHVDVVKELAQADLETIRQADVYLCTPMIAASFYGHIKVVQLLAAFDPQAIDDADLEDDTAMIHACREGHLSVVQFIANFNIKTLKYKKKNGETPLVIAKKSNHSGIVAFIETKMKEADL